VCSNQYAPGAFLHFARSIGAEAHTLMPMITLYCDDSGTHVNSIVAVAGCYLSTVEQWAEFQSNWDAANQREHFGVFHMADFNAKQKQFSNPEWSNSHKRDRTIRSLINIIKTRARFGIACAVVK
jgi:hypothetical protein